METSKTFKREEIKRERWIAILDERYKYHLNEFTGMNHEDCQEIADLLREKPNPAKIINYLIKVRVDSKALTSNNEEIWMFKKEDILKIGEEL